MDNFVIIGLGSIGKRHAANIRERYPNSNIFGVSASGKNNSFIKNIDELITFDQAINLKPNYAIVASPASLHAKAAIILIENEIPLLIEKPLAHNYKDCMNIQKACNSTLFEKLGVGYCLRFMPSAQMVKKYVDQNILGPIYNVRVNVGQYLPSWRPEKNYKHSVSAINSLGGGALLELSHELDYLQWIFGDLSLKHSWLRQSGELEIDVEDLVDLILISKEDIRIDVHLDFVQKSSQRTCEIIGKDGRLFWDLIGNSITLFNSKGLSVLYSDPKYDKNDMYIETIKAFENKINGSKNCLADIKGSSKIIKLIEKAKNLNEWV